jgi:hypothetical protein
MTLCTVCFPAMPVVTLAGSEENSMGRGGLDQSGRRRLHEVSPNGPADPNDGNGGWLDELLAPDEALPEDALAEADDSFKIELDEADVEEFLASHTLTDEQAALLALFLSGTGDPDTVWATLVNSLTDAFLSYVTEEDNPN